MATTVDPSAAARAERVRRHALALIPHTAGAVQPGVVERAVQLAQLGSISLSPDTRAHLSSGRRIAAEQAAELEHAAAASERFLAAIPQLEPERWILTHLAKPFVRTEHGVAGTPAGARILRIAIGFDLLEAQGVPAANALASMRAQPDSYDPALLDTFAGLQGLE